MSSKREKKKLDKSLGHHDLSSEDEILQLRKSLLEWFSSNRRKLPWRDLSAICDQDINRKAYSVWVSEIMLQQTQVATVIDYYKRWMKRWPTLQDLAQASLEEVNEMWAGLGYYSRGKRLREGAIKVVEELGGKIPKDAASLVKELPGVGRYTAGAIASIALNEATGIVDGNVIRVLSRLRIIGADCTNANTIEAFWSLANKIVDPSNPGDFNQAMMELGALICTPKSPQCEVCPVQSLCMAYKKVETQKSNSAKRLKASVQGRVIPEDITDIEEINCKLCLGADVQWQDSQGVCNFPQKPKKKEAREETYAVGIITKQTDKSVKEFLIVQRPETGLLAGLWEFPSTLVNADITEMKAKKELSKFIKKEFGIDTNQATESNHVGEVVHIFSHVHHTYKVYCFEFVDTKAFVSDCENKEKQILWVNEDEFNKSAVSTAMKKVYSKYKKSSSNGSSADKQMNQAKKRKVERENSAGNQSVLDSFFKPKLKKE